MPQWVRLAQTLVHTSSASAMDRNKHAYFLSKFRTASDEEFQEAATRVHELADEAAEAVRQVAAERGVILHESAAASPVASNELTTEERARRTEASTALWNSSTSKRVQYMFCAQALIFSFAFLGPQGLRFGVLWLLLFAATLSWIANRLGRKYTRNVCADADRSIDEKQKSLKTAAVALWPALLVSAFAGVILASAMRAA